MMQYVASVDKYLQVACHMLAVPYVQPLVNKIIREPISMIISHQRRLSVSASAVIISLCNNEFCANAKDTRIIPSEFFL